MRKNGRLILADERKWTNGQMRRWEKIHNRRNIINKKILLFTYALPYTILLRKANALWIYIAQFLIILLFSEHIRSTNLYILGRNQNRLGI